METFSPWNNLIQDSEGNEENGHPVPDSNKTKINNDKETNDVHQNILKEEILQVVRVYVEFTRYGQPQYTSGTQEIPRHEK
jgi:hypothetical protein